MSEQNRILVGVVGAPHGVRGEVRLKSYTGDPAAVATYGELWTKKGQRLSFASHRLLKDDMLVVRFEGIADRDAAQALTNVQLFADRDNLPPAEEDEFYHADLVGLPVFTGQGAGLGAIVSLQNFGAGDLLEIAPPEGESFYVPFTKAFVPHVDLAGGQVIVADAALPGADDDVEGPEA